jgi:hypothetical protein
MIAFAGKQSLRFQVGDVVLRRHQLFVEIFQQLVLLFRVGFFLRKVDVRLQVAAYRSKPFVGSNLLFRALAVAENALRRFLIAPEIGIGDAGFERFQAFAVAFGVKDSSGRARYEVEASRSDAVGLRGSFLSFREFFLTSNSALTE